VLFRRQTAPSLKGPSHHHWHEQGGIRVREPFDGESGIG
jgi:hypothetical protein